MNVVHLLTSQAKERGGAPAIIEGPAEGGRVITFAQLDTRSAQAAALLTSAGIAAGDHVLVFVPMSIDLYVALIGIYRVGAVAMFLDPSAGAEHIARCCAMVPPKGLIAISKAHLLRLRVPALRRIERKFSVGWPVVGARPWRSLERAVPRRAIEDRADADPALITFTSGSTGKPKAAVRSHGFLAHQHAALHVAIELAPGQIDLATLPIFTLVNLASGVTSVIPDADLRRPGAVDPAPILRQIERIQTTRCVASPAFFERLLGAPDLAALRHLKRIDTGGAPVFPGLLQRLQSAMPQARVVAVYGSTEAEPIAHVAWDQISQADVDAMCAGRGLLAGEPVDEIELRILPNTFGEPIAPMTREQLDLGACGAGTPGEIVVAGNHVLGGYLHGHGDAETKFRVDGQIWHRTGDAGYLDERGRLWLLGRAQARIHDYRGELHPFAVECAASQIEGVRRSALVQHQGKRLLVVEASRDVRSETLSRLAWAKLDEVRMMQPIPVDRRHNAKIDYTELQRRLHV